MSKGGGQGSFAQMQEPGMNMDMGGFGGGVDYLGGSSSFNESFNPGPYRDTIAPQPFTGYTPPETQPIQMEEPVPLVSQTDMPLPPPQLGGLGSKGGRSNPYQTDGIVPPDMRGGRVFAGGTPNFDERTGEYRTGGIKPPRGPVKLEPIKMQPMPMPAPDIPPPERMEMDVPAIPDDMLADIESRGTVGPGGGTRGRTGSFRDAIREFRDEFRYQPMPRREPPIFGPPRNFPFPMPRPPRMPPRQPPRMPGRNTQFQMPFFGSPYGQMNPYAGQFSGYGVPSNMFSFAQPHYQPYVPQAYTPPPTYTPPPPTMQLPPGQGAPTFGGGYGGFSGGQGIGGFGRYNLGLARRQFGGR